MSIPKIVLHRLDTSEPRIKLIRSSYPTSHMWECGASPRRRLRASLQRRSDGKLPDVGNAKCEVLPPSPREQRGSSSTPEACGLLGTVACPPPFPFSFPSTTPSTPSERRCRVSRKPTSAILGMRREIIVVDDASTDGTTRKLEAHCSHRARFALCFHPEHLGQGAAVSTGLAHGDRADHRHRGPDPGLRSGGCRSACWHPSPTGDADVVYGSRYVATTRQVPQLWDRLSDRILTAVSNGLTNVALSDATTLLSCVPRRRRARRGPPRRWRAASRASSRRSPPRANAASSKCRSRTAHARRRRATRWFEGLFAPDDDGALPPADWQLGPVTPHRPFRASVPQPPRARHASRVSCARSTSCRCRRPRSSDPATALTADPDRRLRARAGASLPPRSTEKRNCSENSAR